MVLVVAVLSQINAFAPSASTYNRHGPPHVGLMNFIGTTRSAPQTITNPGRYINKSQSLSMTKYDDGTGRGVPILVVILLACVWCFTVPPEFRRALICSDRCVELREEAPQCNNCITGDEWMAGVKQYYANGGGIEWDFSIDPNSKMKMF